jgi:neuron navigator 2
LEQHNLFSSYVLSKKIKNSAESVFSYHIGEIMRTKDAELPELLPIGYLVGETMQIGICLKGRKDNFLQEIRWAP